MKKILVLTMLICVILSACSAESAAPEATPYVRIYEESTEPAEKEAETYSYAGDRANYIIMCDETRGFIIHVGGTSDIDTLAKIAENLEIRQSDVPVFEHKDLNDVGMWDVGRG